MVPVLWRGVPGNALSECVWETIAIFEYLAEAFPQYTVWPRSSVARAVARAIVAEMHAGFRPLRTAMPMNIRARHSGKGMSVDVAANISRIETIWRDARDRFGADGEFLFGAFSAADAMFAPVVMRFMTYEPDLAEDTHRYCDAVRHTSAVASWVEGALAESDFVAEDEPYADARRA
jgi:glutathione S-transferase